MTHFTINGAASDKIWELMARDGAAWVRVSRDGVTVLSLSDVLIAPADVPEANKDHIADELPGNWGGDLSISRMLSSIENRLIELTGGPGIGRLAGWLERIDKDLYHVTTRQEQIDIQHRRYLDDIYRHIFHKDNDNGCPDTDHVTVGVDMAEKPSTAHYAIFGGTGMHEVSEPVYRIVCELIAERESLSNDVEHLRRVASDRGKLLMRMNEEIDRIMD